MEKEEKNEVFVRSICQKCRAIVRQTHLEAIATGEVSAQSSPVSLNAAQ